MVGIKQLFLIVFLTVVACTVLRAQNIPVEEPSSEQIFNRIIGAQTFKEAVDLASQRIKIYVLDNRVGEVLGLPALSDEDLEKLGFLSEGTPRSEIEPCALFEPEINAILIHGAENYKQDILAREFFFAEVFNNLPEDFLRNFRENPVDAPEEEMRRIAEGIAQLNFLLFDIVARSRDMSPTDFASDVSFHFSEISESIEGLTLANWSNDMIRRYLSLVIQTTQRAFPSYACRHITDDILQLTEEDNARIQLLREENLSLLLQLQLFRTNLLTALRKIEWKTSEKVTEPFIDLRGIISASPENSINLVQATPETLEAFLRSHFRSSYPSMELSEVESKTLETIIKFYIFYSNTFRGMRDEIYRKQLTECICSFNDELCGRDVNTNSTKLERLRGFLARVEKNIREAVPSLKTGSSILEFAIQEAEIRLSRKRARHNEWRFHFTEFRRHALVTLGRQDPAAVFRPMSGWDAENMREHIQQAVRKEAAKLHLPSITGEEVKPPSFRNRIDRFFDGEGPKDIRPYR